MINKKSQFFDLLYVVYILFLIAIIGLISQKFIVDAESQMNESAIIDSDNLQLITNYKDRQVGMVDQLFLIGMMGMSLVAVVSAFFVQSAPFFYFISAIVLAILSWINAIYANIYQEFASISDFVTIADQFTFIPLIMRWFPLIMLVISFIIVIIMSAKR